MICKACQDADHTKCDGVGQCVCQHRVGRPVLGDDTACEANDVEEGRNPCGSTPTRRYLYGYRCEKHRAR